MINEVVLAIDWLKIGLVSLCENMTDENKYFTPFFFFFWNNYLNFKPNNVTMTSYIIDRPYLALSFDTKFSEIILVFFVL